MSMVDSASPDDSRDSLPYPETSKELWIIGLALSGLILGLLLWSLFATIDSIAVCPGSITVMSSNKVIQHPEGGAIRTVYVKERQEVRKGDPLIELRDPDLRSKFVSLDKEFIFYTAKIARLKAILDGKSSIDFPEELLDRAHEPDAASMIQLQRETFDKLQQSYRTGLEILTSKIEQLKQKQQEASSLYAAAKTQQEFLQKELEAVRFLLEKKLVRKPRLLGLERENARLQGEIERNQSQVLGYLEGIQELEGQKLKLSTDMNDKAAFELQDAEQKLIDVEPMLQSAREKMDKLVIRSPVQGIVKGLRYKTAGEVIRAAEPIMEIVPENDELVVEAEINPNDIDVVNAGLKAKVVINALSYRYAPSFYGTVEYVSPDAFYRQKDNTKYYVARVHQFDEGWKEVEGKLSPGMPVEVMIINDQRTVFYYIFSPIYQSFQRAFGEA